MLSDDEEVVVVKEITNKKRTRDEAFGVKEDESDDDNIEIPSITIKSIEGDSEAYQFIKSKKTKDTELATVIEIDERTFATSGKAGIIQFWDLYTFECIKEYEAEESPKISALKVLKDQSILSIGKDFLRIWKNGKMISSFKPHLYWTRSCAIFKNEYIVTAGRDSDGLKKWYLDEIMNGETGHYEVVNFEHSWIFSMTNINDKFIGHGGNDKFYIREFDKMKIIKIFENEFQGDAMRSLYDSRYNYLYIGSYGGDFLVIDCENWTVKFKFNLKSAIGGILVLKDGNIAIGLYDHRIVILSDVNSFKICCELSTNQTRGEIYWLANVSDKFFCSIDGGGNYQLWKINFKIKKLLIMLKEQKDTDLNFKFK